MINKMMNNELFLGTAAMGAAFGVVLIAMAMQGHQYVFLAAGAPLTAFGAGVGVLKTIDMWKKYRDEPERGWADEIHGFSTDKS